MHSVDDHRQNDAPGLSEDGVPRADQTLISALNGEGLGRVSRWRKGAVAVRRRTRESIAMDKAVFRGGVGGGGYFASAPLVVLEFDEHEMKMSGPGAKGRIKKSEISNIRIRGGRSTAKLTVRKLDGTRAFRTFGLVGGGAVLRRSLLERGWPVDP